MIGFCKHDFIEAPALTKVFTGNNRWCVCKLCGEIRQREEVFSDGNQTDSERTGEAKRQRSLSDLWTEER